MLASRYLSPLWRLASMKAMRLSTRDGSSDTLIAFPNIIDMFVDEIFVVVLDEIRVHLDHIWICIHVKLTFSKYFG
jgi:hypothetical protein